MDVRVFFVNNLQYGRYVFPDGQFFKYRGFLGQVTNTFSGPYIHGVLGYILPVKMNRTFVGADHAYGHIEGGGFAGTVRP